MKINRISFAVSHLYAIIEKSNYNVVGGAEIRAAKYIKAMQSEGTIIEVITPINFGSTFMIRGKTGILYYNLTDFREPHYLYSLLRTIKAYKDGKSEVIYKRSFDPALLLCGILSKVFRKRLIFGIASDVDCALIKTIRFRGVIIGVLYYLGFFFCDKIILQSRTQLSLISPIFQKKTEIIHKGSDDSLADEQISPYSDRSYFLWVGRFSREKRPDILKLIAPAGFYIKIAGRVEKEYKTILNELLVFPNVEYLGILNPKQLQEQYMHAFALLNTSDFEGFPETFLESWLTGTPAISLNFRHETLILEKGGLFAQGSIERMIEMMRCIASDKIFFENLSRSSRALIKETYTFTNEMETFKKKILEVVKK